MATCFLSNQYQRTCFVNSILSQEQYVSHDGQFANTRKCTTSNNAHSVCLCCKLCEPMNTVLEALLQLVHTTTFLNISLNVIDHLLAGYQQYQLLARRSIDFNKHCNTNGKDTNCAARRGGGMVMR
jgi:hypothetical protein